MCDLTLYKFLGLRRFVIGAPLKRLTHGLQIRASEYSTFRRNVSLGSTRFIPKNLHPVRDASPTE